MTSVAICRSCSRNMGAQIILHQGTPTRQVLTAHMSPPLCSR